MPSGFVFECLSEFNTEGAEDTEVTEKGFPFRRCGKEAIYLTTRPRLGS